jgi:hypothetical protein
MFRHKTHGNGRGEMYRRTAQIQMCDIFTYCDHELFNNNLIKINSFHLTILKFFWLQHTFQRWGYSILYGSSNTIWHFAKLFFTNTCNEKKIFGITYIEHTKCKELTYILRFIKLQSVTLKMNFWKKNHVVTLLQLFTLFSLFSFFIAESPFQWGVACLCTTLMGSVCYKLDYQRHVNGFSKETHWWPQNAKVFSFI